MKNKYTVAAKKKNEEKYARLLRHAKEKYNTLKSTNKIV